MPVSQVVSFADWMHADVEFESVGVHLARRTPRPDRLTPGGA